MRRLAGCRARRRKPAQKRNDDTARSRASPGKRSRAAQLLRGEAERTMGRRNHLRPHAGRLLVPGCRARCLVTADRRMAFSTDLKTRVVLDALDMAFAARKPESVIHQSVQGSQYTSLTFGNRCKDAGVRPSTGSVGDTYDNAMCESFFATLKCELLDRNRFRSHEPRRRWPFSTSSKASTTVTPPLGAAPPVADRIRHEA